MIGYYDYTVILTLVGLFSSVFGMTQAMDGHFRIAILCLAVSGSCDTFDRENRPGPKRTGPGRKNFTAFSWTPCAT